MAMHITQQPAPLGTVAVAAPELAALVGRMLAKKPADRPAMEEVTEQLRALHRGEPSFAPYEDIGPTPRWPWAALGLAAAIAAVLFFFPLGKKDPIPAPAPMGKGPTTGAASQRSPAPPPPVAASPAAAVSPAVVPPAATSQAASSLRPAPHRAAPRKKTVPTTEPNSNQEEGEDFVVPVVR